MRHITDFGISRTQLENIINEWIIGTKAERNRAILKSRYRLGRMMSEATTDREREAIRSALERI